MASPMVHVELYGIARLRAGVSCIEVEAATTTEAMRALAAACPGVVPDVVVDGRLTRHYILSRNGAFIDGEEAGLAPGDTLLLLGAEAGG